MYMKTKRRIDNASFSYAYISHDSARYYVLGIGAVHSSLHCNLHSFYASGRSQNCAILG